MSVASIYGNMVRKNIANRPEKAGRQIIIGLDLETLLIRYAFDKRIPKAYQYLNYKGIKLVADALKNPSTLAYTNIFAPVEILQCFGLTCVSMECLSSYLSGFYIENTLVDGAESMGIAPTLCSYHRTFLGAMGAGILPRARFGVTTSMVCDGNVNSFRALNDTFGVPSFIIDVPHEWSPENRRYVVLQLKELIGRLSEITGKTLDMDELSARLESENRAKTHFLSYVEKRQKHNFPNTLTLMIFQLFASHLDIGMDWAEECFRRMDEEIDLFPAIDQKRILFLHIPPYAEPTLRDYFNDSDRIGISVWDFDLDYTEMLDTAHPLEALADKMLLNIYNGDYSRKLDAITEMIRKYDPDGVIGFCSWGCRQSAGGIQLMKKKVLELGKPMLILDGDDVDRRNCPDGQIKTRFEAFLEELGVPTIHEKPKEDLPEAPSRKQNPKVDYSDRVLS